MIGLFANETNFFESGSEVKRQTLSWWQCCSNACVGIVMCTFGSYRLNQAEVAKEIPSVMMWRAGTFPI
jgi:hypothetical protein